MDDYDKLNVERTDTIDGLAFDEETSSLILLLADGMDWIDENRHLILLQEKLNNYIKYIDSNQYLEKYPNVKKIEWQIHFLFKEPYKCYRLLEYLKMIMADAFKDVKIFIEHGTKSSFD